MDTQTKSAIKSVVLDLRHALEDELAVALSRSDLFTVRARVVRASPATVALNLPSRPPPSASAWSQMRGDCL